MNRLLLIVLLSFIGHSSKASGPILADSIADYYGSINAHGQELKMELHKILNSSHISQDSGADRIVNQCDKFDSNCYKHKNLGYKKARQYLFGYLHLEGISRSSYSVTTAYCRQRFTNQDFPKSGDHLGPMKIPPNTILNTEHSWPQSKFTGLFPKTMQKSDLHALFPLISRVNSIRGNYPFGEVDNVKKEPCSQAILGSEFESSQLQFEPADDMKGNIARALFYFATRYNLKIDPTQENFLRLWNWLDPVDEWERERHEKIYDLQYVRNPFIDKPELVNEIPDF